MYDIKQLENKFKNLINIKIPSAVLTSIVTAVVTVGVIFGFLFYNRGNVMSFLFSDFVKNHPEFTLGENTKNEPMAVVPTVPEIKEIVPVVKENTIVSAVQKANPSVVAITISKEIVTKSFFTQEIISKEKKVVGGGSGFIVSADGYVVTNKHVVSDKQAEYSITLNNGKKYDARVLARDALLDIAILKIDGYNFAYLELGDSDNLELGQSVIAIGNALGEFKNTISTGIISGLSRKVTAGDGRGMTELLDKVIQTDAAINPGNSGGPLLNLEGKVVGVNVAVVQGASNIGFALPINSVKSIISSVRKTGSIVRPYVGIRYVQVTPELKIKNNLLVDYGILVARGKDATEPAIIPGSPAQKAGILENDIILEINGKKMDEDQNFAYLIREKKIGDRLAMKILSAGVYKTVYVTLEKSPD